MADEKIKADEILNDNELDKMAGGFSADTYEDITALREQCGVDLTTSGDYDYMVKILAENYASAGIRLRARNNHPNEYYDNRTGRQISHVEAISTLVEFGHRNGRYGRR